MKRASEGEFGKALRAVDLEPFVYKPADDARNWKPCDFMVWYQPPLVHRYEGQENHPGRPSVAWFEVKDTDAVETFPLSAFRPAQRQGVEEACGLGIPYWIAIWWRRHREWTISDAKRVIDHGQSTPRELLSSYFGIDTTSAQLRQTLKAVLLGEVG